MDLNPALERIPAHRALEFLDKSIAGKLEPEEVKNFRINRYLAKCGYGSRREVEDIVREGRVKVNGKVVTDFSVRVFTSDVVEMDGKEIRPIEHFRYIVLNKPAGYTVTSRAFPNEKYIYELLPEDLHSLRYAGRLDRDSRGLLILTDDGDFLQKITHPGYRTTKRYLVTVDQIPEDPYWQTDFYSGIPDGDDLLRVLRVSIVDQNKRLIEIVLGQGKNRHIRRMFEAKGSHVTDLQRVAIGKLEISELNVPEGSYTEIEPFWLEKGKKDSILGNFNPWKEP